MNNFERLKSMKDEHEMADAIAYYMATHNILKEDGEIDSLSLLRWLQEKATNQ